jgi:hypothetical protein
MGSPYRRSLPGTAGQQGAGDLRPDNGKAERFIQTGLREWAYGRAYNTSDERTAELPRWLHRYNWHRPHGGIGAKPPISRLGLTGNNLLRLHNPSPPSGWVEDFHLQATEHARHTTKPLPRRGDVGFGVVRWREGSPAWEDGVSQPTLRQEIFRWLR